MNIYYVLSLSSDIPNKMQNIVKLLNFGLAQAYEYANEHMNIHEIS